MTNTTPHIVESGEVPRGNLAGFLEFLAYDLRSGFLVFLIALPLCLGISIASGYPPITGIFTAIIGALVTTFLSDSEMTIKGPAAGLIVIAVGCVTDLGVDSGLTQADGYRAALAVGVAAAVLQILFGLFRAGILGEFFPVSAVHGMLAAIGVIIILKQFPVALGESGKGEPLELLRKVPEFLANANWAIASIGLVSLAIMFLWPVTGKRIPGIKAIPAPLVVLLVAIPMGMSFELLEKHHGTLLGHGYDVDPAAHLVKMPNEMFGMFKEVTYPNFAALGQVKAWWWVTMFFVIGSLESLLSAKAVDLIDPWRRKTNMDRDVAAVGVGNLCAAMVGGLPMISEIVRSRANIDNGARTRFADLWHGLFLLVCVALIPTVLHRIPLAALAAMLVYTGFRLAHPTEFVNVYRIGREQLLIFVSTLVGVLVTDLLWGIAIGIGVKFALHMVSGVPVKSLFTPFLDVEPRDETTTLIRARHSAVFSNWIPFRRQLEQIGLVQHRNIVLDLSDTKLVDHSVMEKLHEMQRDFAQEGLVLEIVGLDSHQPVADHEFSARRRSYVTLRRLTIVAEELLEERLEELVVDAGATGYTAIPCHGAGRRTLVTGEITPRVACTRLEIVAPADVCDRVVAALRDIAFDEQRITVCLESVDVPQREKFLPLNPKTSSRNVTPNGSLRAATPA
jgi:MFS superfamily sulfate permease-like transporter